jgi:hypothetical protein
MRAAANVTNSSSGASKVASNNTRKQKLLNLNTYTYHALGDYQDYPNLWHDRLILYSTGKYLIGPLLDAAYCPWIRVNLNTECPRCVFIEPMADEYRSNCQRSNDDNAISVRSAKICITYPAPKQTQIWKVSPMIISCSTT